MMLESISKSSLIMANRCLAQFERRYINGEIILPGISARRGSAVHKAGEVNHIQKIKSKVDMSVSDLQDAARDHYVHLVKEKGVFIPKDFISEKSNLLNDGLNAAVGLTKVYREELAPQIQPVLVEEKILLDVGLDMPISGIIDVYTEDGWLPDLKTADKSKNQAEADNSLDLTFYSGLVHHLTGAWPKKVSLEVLVNTKEPKHQPLETKRGPQEWANLILRVRMLLAQIRTGLFPPCSPDSWWCSHKWCGYWWTCKYVIRR